jgi:hypothetical protein
MAPPYPRFKEIISLSTDDVPCNSSADYSYYTCAREIDAKLFTSSVFRHPGCSFLSTLPCWIPQIDSLLSVELLKSMTQCTTWEQYNCMIDKLRLVPNA